jgi:F-type H+-transporting ATPase subunit b
MIGLPNVTSLYVFLAFGISYWILKKFLFVPLSAILEAREAEEHEAQNSYAESVQRLERAVSAGEAKLSAARQEALRTREGLRAQGMALLEQRLAEAHAVSAREIARASLEIQEQAERSSRELPERARGLARELAEKVLGRKLAA